jgi:hypothetical protein
VAVLSFILFPIINCWRRRLLWYKANDFGNDQKNITKNHWSD